MSLNPWWWRAATRSENKAFRAVRGRCETCIIFWVYLWEPFPYRSGEKEGFNPVRSARRGKQTPEKVETYLGLCRDLVERAEGTAQGTGRERRRGSGMVRLIRPATSPTRQIDQVDRRLLQGERIPHQEKVFSIFEPTRAGSRRARRAGRWNCILHHKMLWKERLRRPNVLFSDLRM